jgi:ABC-type multidrug transport system ATPase subunit
LDPRIRAELLRRDREPARPGETTILLTTHYLDEAERLCDRIAIIDSGKIVALNSPPGPSEQSLGAESSNCRVLDRPEDVLDRLRNDGVAGDDAFSVGATVTVPLPTRRGRGCRGDSAAGHQDGCAEHA